MPVKKASPVKKIKTLQSKLKLDDPTYRAMLEAQTGKTSCKDLSKEEQLKVISHMQALVDGKSSPANASKNELLNASQNLSNQTRCSSFNAP